MDTQTKSKARRIVTPESLQKQNGKFFETKTIPNQEIKHKIFEKQDKLMDDSDDNDDDGQSSLSYEFTESINSERFQPYLDIGKQLQVN